MLLGVSAFEMDGSGDRLPSYVMPNPVVVTLPLIDTEGPTDGEFGNALTDTVAESRSDTLSVMDAHVEGVKSATLAVGSTEGVEVAPKEWLTLGELDPLAVKEYDVDIVGEGPGTVITGDADCENELPREALEQAEVLKLTDALDEKLGDGETAGLRELRVLPVSDPTKLKVHKGLRLSVAGGDAETERHEEGVCDGQGDAENVGE